MWLEGRNSLKLPREFGCVSVSDDLLFSVVAEDEPPLRSVCVVGAPPPDRCFFGFDSLPQQEPVVQGPLTVRLDVHVATATDRYAVGGLVGSGLNRAPHGPWTTVMNVGGRQRTDPRHDFAMALRAVQDEFANLLAESGPTAHVTLP